MQIIDLTDDYIRYVIHQNKPEFYEDSLPPLFEHYYQFWASRSSYFYKDESEIWHHNELMRSRLSFLEEKFSSNGLRLEEIGIALFVGHGTSNGHALLLDERWTVWLPIEAYPSPLAIDIFMCHEIAHDLHYQRHPDFFFKDEEEKNSVFRQTITEGIATITSKYVLGIDDKQALWADYLPVEQVRDWYQECLSREAEIMRVIARKLERSDRNLFSYSGSKNVLENRAGYYAALVLMQRLLETKKLSVNDLFLMGKQEFFERVGELLKTQPA